MLALYEVEGVDLTDVHLSGADLDYANADTAHFAGFNTKYLGFLARWAAEFGCQEHLEVVHTTRTKPLALIPGYFTGSHGEGQFLASPNGGGVGRFGPACVVGGVAGPLTVGVGSGPRVVATAGAASTGPDSVVVDQSPSPLRMPGV